MELVVGVEEEDGAEALRHIVEVEFLLFGMLSG